MSCTGFNCAHAFDHVLHEALFNVQHMHSPSDGLGFRLSSEVKALLQGVLREKNARLID